MSTSTTRNESAALDILTMKGAQLRHAGFCAAVLPLALHAYKHGSDREQWNGKGSAARPLRGAWSHVFTPAANGRLPADAAARAFRAVAQALTAELENKKRDTTEEGCDLFLAALETIVAGIIAPARAAAEPKDETKVQADKLARAVRVIQDASVTLDDAMADALRAVLAAHDALRAAAKPASKPAKPASKPADALTTAIADALTAAGIPETV